MQSAMLSALGAIGLAVAVANMLARRFLIPSVLVYLFFGALAGPSILGLVDPDELGDAFEIALEVLVALIVFEGAFSIDVAYLRRVGSVVRNLVTVGLAITLLSATLLAGVLEVLPWRTALLFGALVSVTGPTVITPLVRQIRLNDHVRAVLLGEGVLIDPIGAVLAVVALDVALSGVHAEPLFWAPSRLLGGAAIGLGGVAIVRAVLVVYRTPGTDEVSLLLVGLSVATFATAEQVLSGSGLAAMAVMGVVLAAMPIPHAETVRSFEDDLSKLMIGGVYVLATATVELELLANLWPAGFLVVLGLMVLVRPAATSVSSLGSDLSWRERAYIGLIGPRGVVAAAIAAFAGKELGEEHGGPTLTALVFLTILLTVAVQSSYAGLLARLLRVRAMKAVIAGAGDLARRLARQLGARGFDVILIDQDEGPVERARAQGLRAEQGDATDVRLLQSIGAGEARIAVGTTSSDQANLLFCQYVLAANPEAEAFARVHQADAMEAFNRSGIHAISEADALATAMMELIGSPVLFEALAPMDDRMTVEVPVGSGLERRFVRDLKLPERVLVLLVRRGDQEIIPNGNTRLFRNDRMVLWGASDSVRRAREHLVTIE